LAPRNAVKRGFATSSAIADGRRSAVRAGWRTNRKCRTRTKQKPMPIMRVFTLSRQDRSVAIRRAEPERRGA